MIAPQGLGDYLPEKKSWIDSWAQGIDENEQYDAWNALSYVFAGF